ncbi:MAG: metallophosphoesterase [Akkermansia sp.]|nr:metallophosphoesterase [Akkermansia sp.]
MPTQLDYAHSAMFLHVTIIAAFVALYVIVRAIFPLKTKLFIKLLLAAIATMAAFKFHVFYLIEGENFFTPQLSAGLVWSGCWLFCAVFGFALSLIAADFLRLPLYIALRLSGYKPHRSPWRKYNNRINLVLLLSALGITGWGTWCGIRLPETETHLVVLDSIPDNACPIRLVQLTDLHADSTKDAAFYRSIVQRTNAVNPDVVVITGDFADGTVQTCGAALAPLAELSAPMGVYAVTGNHDYFWGSHTWRQHLESLGVRIINNQAVQLKNDAEGECPPKELCLIGLPDPMGRRTGEETADLSTLIPPAEQRRGPVVLLAHQPRVANVAAKYDIDLQLSGHTHGGQFPGLQQLVAQMNNGYVRGLYRVGNMQLYVSPGTSLWTPVCLRLGVPAEISVLNLYPPDKK